jgi:hypothetical protein
MVSLSGNRWLRGRPSPEIVVKVPASPELSNLCI